MERFVWFLAGGGVALVAGLWIAAYSATGSPSWVLGALLAALGSAGLLVGIGTEVEAFP